MKTLKTVTERYTWEEFQIIADVKSMLGLTCANIRGGNYQPYHVRKSDYCYGLHCSITINKKEISALLKIKTAKLAYAIQVWEIAQALTAKRYGKYLNHEWIRSNDPIKQLVITDELRPEAEKYFAKMLEEICHDQKITVSEYAVFESEQARKFREDKLILNVCVNADELSEEMKHNIYLQFSQNEQHYSFDQKNLRFTYEEIKDYFIHLDARLLALLNADDGLKDITPTEKELFDRAERLNLTGIINAVNNGADINAVDIDGETALAKVVRASKYDFIPFGELEKYKSETPDFTNEEKIEVAQKLLAMGADIDFFAYDGLNGLMDTSYAHNPVLMKFLLDSGANPNFNYYPEDGIKSEVSSALNNVYGDYHCYDDADVLDKMEELLLNAGAVGYIKSEDENE